MFRRSSAALFFLFVLFAYQVAAVTTASAGTENFYWKSTYLRGGGTLKSTSSTAACPTGTERGSVLTAPFAIHGVKPGEYACYTVCRAGYKGTSSICWQSPAPANYVDCGAGIAASKVHCTATVTNQIVSLAALTLAAVSLGTTESPVGEDVADLVTVSKEAVKLGAKSPKILIECEHLGKDLLPLAKATEKVVRADARAVANGEINAAAFSRTLKSSVEGGLSDAKIKAAVLKLKKAILASRIVLRAGSTLYYAVNDTNTSTIDYIRDATAIAAFAFAIYEITHPGDVVPASTLLGTISAFMYPEYGVAY